MVNDLWNLYTYLRFFLSYLSSEKQVGIVYPIVCCTNSGQILFEMNRLYNILFNAPVCGPLSLHIIFRKIIWLGETLIIIAFKLLFLSFDISADG